MTNQNELTVQGQTTQIQSAQSALTATSNIYSSIVDDGTRASKVKIYNAMATPTHQLSECVNETLQIVDIIAHNVDMVDEKTGELLPTMRVVLIDVNGDSYGTVSKGVFQSLKSIFNLVGQPSYYDEPLALKVLSKKGNRGFKFLTLELL